MKIRSIVLLGAALFLGLMSVFLAREWLDGLTPTVQGETVPTTTVVVARAPLRFGAAITPEALREVEWPAGSVPEGAFAKIADVVGSGESRVALRPIEANEPLLASKVSGFGGRATLSAVITEGMRAVTIRVNDVYGVAGFVLPGDRVDVLLTRDRDGSASNGNDRITDVLLQNIKVLGVDQEAAPDKEQARVARAVTLEVSTEDAQKLTLGSTVGTLSLSLRNVAAVDAGKARTITVRDLGSAPPPRNAEPAAAKPAPPPTPRVEPATVRIVRGTEASNVQVRREGAVRN